MHTSSKPMRCLQLLCGLLFTAAHASAQVTLPAHTIDRFDAPFDGQTIDAKGRGTIAIQADELDLGNTTIGSIRASGRRAADVVVMARVLRIGPNTQFDMAGQVMAETFESLRGGDVYLVADTLIVNGLVDGRLVPPVKFLQEGGFHPQDAQRMRARAGRTYILVNKIQLAEEFVRARTQALNAGGSSNSPVPAPVMRIISRGFSSGNSVHRIVAAGTPVLWQGLGDAYQGWIAEEPLSTLAGRELNLTEKRVNPLNGGNLPDVVGPMGDAAKYVPADILSPWYISYLQRNASKAQAAIGRKDYDVAAIAIRQARPLTATAPNAALTSDKFKSALADLQAAETTLAQESVVEELTFPVDGGAPVRVTVIRDLAAGRISVIPNQLLFSPVVTGNVVRVGFMSQVGDDVQVSMLGRLVVDPSLVELVRARFPGNAEVRVADELVYDTLNLQIGDALKDGSARVLGGGSVSFELLLKGTQFRQAMLRLGQPFGVDATVNWKHSRLNLGDRTSRVNVSLNRTEMTLVAKNGVLTNAGPQAIEVDYVLDGAAILTKGLPARINAGAALTPGCAAPSCYVPGSAIRRVLVPSEVDTWLSSTPPGSSVIPFTFENHLEDASRPGEGRFSHVVLEIAYKASPNAVPQQTGAFTLGRRGAAAARRSWRFIAPPGGGGKLEISGRAYWQHGYHDIPLKVVESTTTIIDSSWLKP